MDRNILLLDEVSIILLWIGAHGLLDQVITSPSVYASRNYIYLYFILISLYLNVE